MAFDRIEDIIEDYRQGKMVLLVDDEDRENEGDLLLAADCCTAQAISFMAREARGLICLTLTDEHCKSLGLEQMVPSNGSVFATAFTVSIEATTGVTTGISAADRARTVQAAVNPGAVPDDLVQPGHIFPLRARDGGVLTRAGHTEAGCDLARMAGFTPASVIVEVMNDDGTMARRPDLELFAEKHGIRIGTIADLIHYRLSTEHTIVRIGERELPTVHGTFRLFSYEDRIEGGVHMAMVMGDIRREDPTLVRVHVVDPLRDLVGAEYTGPANWTLWAALQRVAEEGCGVVVVLANHESSQALLERIPQLTQPPRQYTRSQSRIYSEVGTGAQILQDLGIGKLRHLGPPLKYAGLTGYDLEVIESIPFPG
ncbi:bifunctional 3,4-dihydroxy-2-butanone-4-phosphate synthase/GTP cyclohydrolase II [Pseudomonas syringae group genomosp. 3]|uniref:3,4-dihydroxy-2-butanone 4-phosphate synthase n=1 Tax=Pseudomonas syringae pv. tomato (strain ATCC BAA-871 / DC3000) TaxID=223283 RepID=RIBB_PSESM|nr:bifunctional 3,4-dihydroxy-2-butanone-4-phosphate synthase/GTP cyclohydrolase II [Pseudomonas syringae group genomosp. 3]Q882G0.1 RecName: Full=3,4-dihydroxy-2-butanone 4-phosphate synthase; Short=DHBP synthase [Pseudomonas syringae pv. tomato str. DC3000]AAO56170.1 3,4-dihydroxy-2-butanone 4-phosphate synthase/GTP cyclohydrolase II [Pseudomonas syringae pv. tomato str. DC3000]KKI26338.1 3,4-dihydroxy-2-butanone 4-phosphate synthase [Pseudomonas syringae pv. persicae]MBF9245718.1 bifunctiona